MVNDWAGVSGGSGSGRVIDGSGSGANGGVKE